MRLGRAIDKYGARVCIPMMQARWNGSVALCLVVWWLPDDSERCCRKMVKLPARVMQVALCGALLLFAAWTRPTRRTGCSAS